MFQLCVAILVCYVGYHVNARTAQQGPACSLPVKQLPKYEPLLIINSKLALPALHGHVGVSTNDDVIVACPGKGNELDTFDKSDVTSQCAGNEVLQVAGQGYSVDKLGCIKSIAGDLKIKVGKCSVKGTAMELGFTVRTSWYPMIDVCHDMKASATYYAQHVLYGAALTSSEHRGNRPAFKEGGVYETFNADTAYKQTTQLATLTALLQSRSLAENYLNHTFLARGHLAPNADFVLDAYQDLSFFYVNAAPQWQSVNAGNWVSLENTVRRHAIQGGQELKVITGTYGVLTLQDKIGTMKEIYLVTNGTDRKLPVPLYFWKIVYDPATQAGMGFVSINKFFGREKPICPDVCARYNWRPTKGKWDDVSQGHVYCCEVAALRSAINNAPRITVKRALVFEG